MSGPPLTYQDCIPAIEITTSYLQGHQVVNNHPGRVLVSQRMTPLFSIAISTDGGGKVDEVALAPRLKFKARYWPERPLSNAAIITVINAAMAGMRKHDARALVPSSYRLEAVDPNVVLSILFSRAPGLSFEELTKSIE